MEERCFNVCDTNAHGCPMHHVSMGCEQQFGYNAKECLGKKFGAVFGVDSVMQDGLAVAAETTALSRNEVAEALRRLAGRVTSELQAMLKSQSDRYGFAVVINRKKSGALVTCSLHMRVLRHPRSGWRYMVACHTDVSQKLAVFDILSTALGGDQKFQELMDEYRHQSTEPMKFLYDPAGEKYFHEVAIKMWRSMFFETQLKLQGKFKSTTRSIASRSTASQSTATGIQTRPRSSSSWSDSDSDDVGGNVVLAQKSSKDAAVQVTQHITGAPGQQSMPSSSGSSLATEAPTDLENDVSSDESPLNAKIKRVRCKQLQDLPFALALLTPLIEGCPFVLCSAGFSQLTGYTSEQLVGASIRSLLHGVPDELVNSNACSRMGDLCDDAAKGRFYRGSLCQRLSFFGRATADRFQQPLPEGEITCTETIRLSTGGLLPCMFLVKQVDLDDEMFILCILENHQHRAVTVPPGPNATEFLCTTTHSKLIKSMETALQVLSRRFWLSTSMRRQTAATGQTFKRHHFPLKFA